MLRLLQRENSRRLSLRKLTDYAPYPKQRDFHAAGRAHRERLLMAANQVGKTLCAGAEVAMHLTARYPDWWDGHVCTRPLPWWVGGVTAESTRDNPQRILLGRDTSWGTGMIPRDALIGEPLMRRGVANAVDSILCRFGGGADVQADQCSLAFKSYDQGREKWQGETLGGVWLDEESDEDIYTEALTRTNVGLNPVMMTFTPLKGVTGVVKRFILDKVPGTHVTTMTIEDADHYTPEQRAAIIAAYPQYERDARTKGIPQLGSGRVFPLSEDAIRVAGFAIPEHWPQICGIDFGWDHPSAAARLAWDRDNDVVYVTATHRQRQQTPLLFASTVKPWGAWLPWAWPHDGKQSGGKFDAKDQKQLQQLYAEHDLKMLGQHAQFEDATNGVEAGVLDMLQRMQTNRWKVFSHLVEWFEEFNLYHRKDGLIVKLNDDLLCASRYAYMMRRFAIVRPTGESMLNFPSQFERRGGLGSLSTTW